MLCETKYDHHILQKMNGEILWETPIQDWFFSSLSDALQHRKKAERFILTGNKKKKEPKKNKSQFSTELKRINNLIILKDPHQISPELFKLKNLRELYIRGIKAASIPSKIKKIKNLKILEILYLLY